MRFGPQRLGRDIALVHDRMIAEGRAVWLGQIHSGQVVAPSPDVERAVARVRALFNQA
jgi:copper oxidase (laccase) domain-containing protein